MPKYRVVRGFSWKTCTVYDRDGEVIDPADLKTAEGEPVPKSLVAHLLARGNLEAVTDGPADGEPATPPAEVAAVQPPAPAPPKPPPVAPPPPPIRTRKE